MDKVTLKPAGTSGWGRTQTTRGLGSRGTEAVNHPPSTTWGRERIGDVWGQTSQGVSEDEGILRTWGWILDQTMERKDAVCVTGCMTVKTDGWMDRWVGGWWMFEWVSRWVGG